jgi:predicted amidophosphoribosyltransferase
VTPSTLAHLLSILAPPACAACRAPLPASGARLCPGCVRALPWLAPGGCPRCALPAHSARGCPARAAAWSRAWSPLAYDGPARALVTALKFRGALPLAAVMAAQLAANLPPDLRPPPGAGAALVPVPAQRSRARRRGFDAAALIARNLAPRLGLEAKSCLRRRDRGARQLGASRSARRRPGRLLVEPRGTVPRFALLVDDVHTTGATLDACAVVLRAAGAREVVALSYARTL